MLKYTYFMIIKQKYIIKLLLNIFLDVVIIQLLLICRNIKNILQIIRNKDIIEDRFDVC